LKEILVLLVLLVVVIGISGCTDYYTGNGTSGPSQSNEQLVGTYKVTSSDEGGVFGEQKLLVQLPANTNRVKVVYNMTAESSYGMGSNGNLGVTSEQVVESSGQDPIMLSTDNQYLEGGPGKTINGELTFSGGKTFYYSGNFVSGTISVYATT